MKKIICSTIILLMLGFLLPQLVLAIGQMTKPIILKDVLRGQTVQETLTLYGEEKEITYGLIAEGDIKDWATFYLPEDLKNPIQEIKIPAQFRADVIAKFKVPKDTPNGTYTGEVAIFTLPESVEGKEGVVVGVGLSIGRDVSITVTDKEIVKFDTTIIPLKYGVGKGEPLKIKVIYDNQGNVSIRPDLQLKITQVSTGNIIHNAIYPYPEGEEAVKPFERREFPNLIEWQTAGRENGKYKAEIKVLLNGNLIEEESFRFDVGVDIMALLLANIALLGGGSLMFGWFVIGGILIIIAGILTFLSKKPQLLKAGLAKIKKFQFLRVGLKKIKSLF